MEYPRSVGNLSNELKKLGHWGKEGEDFDFEWPTMEELRALPKNVKVDKVVMNSLGCTINSCQLFFSNGSKSPLF